MIVVVFRRLRYVHADYWVKNMFFSLLDYNLSLNRSDIVLSSIKIFIDCGNTIIGQDFPQTHFACLDDIPEPLRELIDDFLQLLMMPVAKGSDA